MATKKRGPGLTPEQTPAKPELTPDKTLVNSGGNSRTKAKAGKKQGPKPKKGKSPAKPKAKTVKKAQKRGNLPQLPPGTVAKTGQQPPKPPGSGGFDPKKPIGPGNPPAKTIFRPGQSGNPAGYPKGRPNTKTILRYWLDMEENIPNPFAQGETMRVRVLDSMTLGVINKARKGDVAAYREIMDRVDGKPVQSNKIILEKETAKILVGFKSPSPIKTATPADKQEAQK